MNFEGKFSTMAQNSCIFYFGAQTIFCICWGCIWLDTCYMLMMFYRVNCETVAGVQVFHNNTYIIGSYSNHLNIGMEHKRRNITLPEDRCGFHLLLRNVTKALVIHFPRLLLIKIWTLFIVCYVYEMNWFKLYYLFL